MMKQGIWIGALVLIVFALYGWLSFNNSTEKNGYKSDLQGVIITAPPDYHIAAFGRDGEDPTLQEAAAELENILKEYPNKNKIGLKYSQSGGVVYLMVNRQEDVIQQLAANSYGTAVQKTWQGDIYRRLNWCKNRGNLTPEGLSDPISKNLYH